MLIEDKVLKYWIDNFYGYGSWHALKLLLVAKKKEEYGCLKLWRKYFTFEQAIVTFFALKQRK